jgi:hypothetical protein
MKVLKDISTKFASKEWKKKWEKFGIETKKTAFRKPHSDSITKQKVEEFQGKPRLLFRGKKLKKLKVGIKNVKCA